MPEIHQVYRRWISPWLHSVSGLSGACRFQPSCSEYAVMAVANRGPFTGSALALWRLLRCNPFCRGGFDPVPGLDPANPVPSGPYSSIRTDEGRHLP